MTVSNKVIRPILRELPVDASIDEIETESKKEIEVHLKTKNIFQTLKNQKLKKKWEESISYHLLNPKKYGFGLRDL